MSILKQLEKELTCLTLAEQSEVTGVTICTLSRIWNGKLSPKLETIEKMANAVGMELTLSKRDKS